MWRKYIKNEKFLDIIFCFSTISMTTFENYKVILQKEEFFHFLVGKNKSNTFLQKLPCITCVRLCVLYHRRCYCTWVECKWVKCSNYHQHLSSTQTKFRLKIFSTSTLKLLPHTFTHLEPNLFSHMYIRTKKCPTAHTFVVLHLFTLY